VTRHPKAEGRQRAAAIEGTRTLIKNFQQEHFNIQLRFYQDMPAHRGAIIEYTDGKRISYLSAYYWPTFKSRSLPEVLVIKDSCDQPNILVQMLESWIKHYWGTGKIHTIVFDFDDTLADTMDIQVEAWMEAIDSALQIGIILESQLSAEVRRARSNHDKYHKCIKDIFIELQMSEQIIAAILPDIAASVKERIDSDRFNIRQKKLLEKGELFPGVREKLRSLRAHYQLVIVTATSSVLVSRFLDKREVADCFSIILGKDDPKHQWENVHSKAIFLIEVSGLAGIPLDRLVFVGDNTADYEAASQMGVTFIEAAHTAERVGKRSLIKGLPNIKRKPPKRFSGFSDDSFDKILAQLNQEDL
jgi:phosphoglycolate phosphatase-like HAD superfamily hydrolase